MLPNQPTRTLFLLGKKFFFNESLLYGDGGDRDLDFAEDMLYNFHVLKNRL